MIEKITNHAEQALNRLLEQYKGKTNLINFIQVYLKQVQDIEDSLEDFDKLLDIGESSGQQLDEIGDIVVQPRLGNTDERYRILLYTKIGINTSKGESPKVIEIFKILTEADHVHLINLGLGNIELETTAEFADQDEVNFIFESVQKLLAAGVRVEEIRCTDPVEAFGFNNGNPGAPGVEGFHVGKFSTPHRYALPFSFASDNVENPTTAGFGGGHLDPLVGGEFKS